MKGARARIQKPLYNVFNHFSITDYSIFFLLLPSKNGAVADNMPPYEPVLFSTGESQTGAPGSRTLKMMCILNRKRCGEIT